MFIERITVKCFLFPGFSKLIYKAKEIENHKPDKFSNVINIVLAFLQVSPYKTAFVSGANSWKRFWSHGLKILKINFVH